MKNVAYLRELQKLKKQKIAPRAQLWTRITATLQRRGQGIFWPPLQRLAYSTAVLAVCGFITLTCGNYYEQYRLDRYLVLLLDYTSYSSEVYLKQQGTFI